MKRKNKCKFKIKMSEKKRQYIFVIKQLTGREIKRKYARSYLGIMWSVLGPLLNMIVMSLIFSYMFKKSIENFPVYYLTGQIIYALFNTAPSHAMTALVDNKNLIIKSKLSKQTFVLSRIYTAFVNFLYTLIPYVGILIFFRIKVSFKALLFIPDIFLITVFATGVGYILATIYVFFADIKHLYSIFMTIIMYMSAIFYPAERLPGFMQEILSFNPVYLAIDIARYSVVYNLYPYYTEWIKLVVYAIAAFVIGVFVYRKNENKMMMEI